MRERVQVRSGFRVFLNAVAMALCLLIGFAENDAMWGFIGGIFFATAIAECYL